MGRKHVSHGTKMGSLMARISGGTKTERKPSKEISKTVKSTASLKLGTKMARNHPSGILKRARRWDVSYAGTKTAYRKSDDRD